MSNKISTWTQYCASPRQTQDTGYKTGKVVPEGSGTLLLDEGAVLARAEAGPEDGGKRGSEAKGAVEEKV